MITLATISALRAQSVLGLPANEVAFVAGYFSTNDGGGGFFTYDSGSSSADDGGLVIAPNSGSGRWLRTYSEDINLRWFGAKGDGYTDDSSAFNGALDGALAAGTAVFVPQGHFCIKAALTRFGSVQLRGTGYESILDGSGNLYQSDPTKDLGYRMLIQSELGGTTYTASGTLYAGDNQLTLAGVSGLSVGDDVFLELGVSASDSSQPFYRLFGRIISIASNVITLDNAIPEDINGTSHKLWKNVTPARNISVSDLRFINLPFSVDTVENALFEDLYWDIVSLAIITTRSYNVTYQNIYFEIVTGLFNIGPATIYGAVFSGWGMYGCNIRDVRVRSLRAVAFFSCEAESREVRCDNIHLGLDQLSPNTSNINLFQNGGMASPHPVFFRNIYLNVLADAHTFIVGDDVYLENLHVTGNAVSGSVYANPPRLGVCLDKLTGAFYYKNNKYYLRQSFLRLIKIPASGTGASFHNLGVKGLVTGLQLFVSTLTGITSVAKASTSAGGSELISQLTVGQFSASLRDATIIGPGTPAFFDDDTFIRITTDGSQPVHGYMLARGEILVSSTTADTSPETRIGSGSPSISADYIGQGYFDDANVRLYFASAVGGGAADWVALN